MGEFLGSPVSVHADPPRANYAAHTDYIQAELPAEQALALAEKMDDPVRQARALYILAYVANFGDLQRSARGQPIGLQ